MCSKKKGEFTMKIVSIYMEDSLHEKLKLLAKLDRRSVNSYINILLQSCVENKEVDQDNEDTNNTESI